jgi:glycosyltransferase involved in cell wall biosynthesis
MEIMPRITVGIPAYKSTYLREAISSVLSQTHQDLELLISDDSRDGSVRGVVEAFDDPRIRLIEGPRQGLVANSVQVWEHASSDLLKFLYDDDLLYPPALAAMSEVLLSDDRHVYAFCRRVVIDEAGRETRRLEGFAGEGWTWFEPDAVPNYLVRNMHNAVGEPSSVLIRRSAFPDAGCLSSYAGLPIRHLIDVAFFMNAGRAGRAVAVCDYLTAFREHPEQVSALRTAPAFSRGLLEWEIVLRGAVQQRLVEPQIALAGVPHLRQHYRSYGKGFSEVVILERGLAALEEMLAAGRREVITDEFLSHLRLAEELIGMRTKSGASPLLTNHKASGAA